MIIIDKHKAAYELRISDWSSDVCSSDLFGCLPRDDAAAELAYFGLLERGLLAHENCARMVRDHRTQEGRVADRGLRPDEREAPEEGDRRSEQQKHIEALRREHADRKSTRLNSSH